MDKVVRADLRNLSLVDENEKGSNWLLLWAMKKKTCQSWPKQVWEDSWCLYYSINLTIPFCLFFTPQALSIFTQLILRHLSAIPHVWINTSFSRSIRFPSNPAFLSQFTHLLSFTNLYSYNSCWWMGWEEEFCTLHTIYIGRKCLLIFIFCYQNTSFLVSNHLSSPKVETLGCNVVFGQSWSGWPVQRMLAWQTAIWRQGGGGWWWCMCVCLPDRAFPSLGPFMK